MEEKRQMRSDRGLPAVMKVGGSAVAALAMVLCSTLALAQSAAPAPTPTPAPEEIQPAGGTSVVVTAPRMDIPLKENPAATTVVSGEQLDNQPKSVNAKEVLLLVPGVKVDDQADGERVHLSIRGQGILTETGIRGIKILLDGLPLNDPSGFAPDLFDVDWATVKKIEVFRGPASALWGGGASGGIINIETRDGGTAPASADVEASAGSHGFWKTLAEVGGTDGNMNYRVSGSRMMDDGYRVHTASSATNFYSKLRFDLGGGNRITAILAGTSYFNENAEGLNIDQVLQDPEQPNPDALTYNEFQRTRRVTLGVTGNFALSSVSTLDFAVYGRHTEWREAVPSSVDHRDYDSPGGFIQYKLDTPAGTMKNHLSLGADLDLQTFNEYRRPNLGRAQEGPEILSDQDVHQRGTGVYLLDQLELSPQWSVMAGVRTDSIDNTLTDNLKLDGDRSGEKSFSKTTARVGVAWNPTSEFGAYASWAQGFLPPATEELSHNPDGFGGFNQHLVPATSSGFEAGVRGALAGTFTYDVAVYRLLTSNDFGRYRVPSRPLETFYDNAGFSRRYGVETLFGFYPDPKWSFELAYTYSHFVYDHVTFNAPCPPDEEVCSPVTLYGTRLPNSPEHQITFDAEYRITPELSVGLETETQSRAYIDPTNTTWIGGYTLYDARVSYLAHIAGAQTEFFAYARNFTGKKYIAFTEPDPDGNSYQPGPEQEFFGGVHVRF
jgi:iron complex outermembrane receptor protein